MDRISANQQRLAFAKVCVEVEAAMEIPRFIEVELRDGSLVQVQVDILWMHIKCSQCKIFGHEDKICPRKVVKEAVKAWVPKKVTQKVEDTKVEKVMQKSEDSDFEMVQSGRYMWRFICFHC